MRPVTLRPMISYYGGKWRASPKYPPPTYDRLVEPFAGGAGYSLRYPERKVELYDVDPIICGVWDYLIHVSEAEVLSLPVDFLSVDELTSFPQEARWLIGFWLRHGIASPAKSRPKKGWGFDYATPTNPSFWGVACRQRIASQVGQIRHWTIDQKSYEDVGGGVASWFVDPPYSTPAGRHYRCSDVDFADLGQWCMGRQGQVTVCEQEGADWLPFEPLGAFHSTRGHSKEVVWTADQPDPPEIRYEILQ